MLEDSYMLPSDWLPDGCCSGHHRLDVDTWSLDAHSTISKVES